MTVQTIDYLKSIYPSLSATSKRIADYFVSSVTTLESTSILEVATACDTSKSAVVRLCKRLGYSGYKDFLNSLSVQMATTPQQLPDFYPEMGIEDITNSVIARSIKALQDTKQILDTNQLDAAVTKLCEAQQILFFGVGNSGLVAMDAELKFRRIGYHTFSGTSADNQLIGLASAKASDVVVLLSNSGENERLLESCNLAKAQSIATIAITAKKDKNPLAKKADISLLMANTETMLRVSAMSSRITMLSLVDILFSAVVSRKYTEVEETLARSAGYLQTLKTSKQRR